MMEKTLKLFAVLALAACIALPGAASAEEPDPETVERLKREILRAQILQQRANEEYLEDVNDKLQYEARKQQIDNEEVGAQTRYVDREYIKKLDDAAETGNIELWKQIKSDYDAERRKALQEDKEKYDAKQEQKQRVRDFLKRD